MVTDIFKEITSRLDLMRLVGGELVEGVVVAVSVALISSWQAATQFSIADPAFSNVTTGFVPQRKNTYLLLICLRTGLSGLEMEQGCLII